MDEEIQLTLDGDDGGRATAAHEVDVTADAPPPRRRGRPRKDAVTATDADAGGQPPSIRRRPRATDTEPPPPPPITDVEAAAIASAVVAAEEAAIVGTGRAALSEVEREMLTSAWGAVIKRYAPSIGGPLVLLVAAHAAVVAPRLALKEEE